METKPSTLIASGRSLSEVLSILQEKNATLSKLTEMDLWRKETVTWKAFIKVGGSQAYSVGNTPEEAILSALEKAEKDEEWFLEEVRRNAERRKQRDTVLSDF